MIILSVCLDLALSQLPYSSPRTSSLPRPFLPALSFRVVRNRTQMPNNSHYLNDRVSEWVIDKTIKSQQSFASKTPKKWEVKIDWNVIYVGFILLLFFSFIVTSKRYHSWSIVVVPVTLTFFQFELRLFQWNFRQSSLVEKSYWSMDFFDQLHRTCEITTRNTIANLYLWKTRFQAMLIKIN